MADEDKKAKGKEEEKEEKPAKKRGMLKWIIIVAVVLVLAGGSLVIWKTFLKASPESEEGAAEGVDLGPTFPMEPYIVNLAGTSGERYLKVTLELELGNPKLIKEVERRKPQLRDTILLLLSSKTFEDVATFRGKTKLRSEITARLNGILPPGSIKKVYFTEFVVQ